jgi:hypothetical protein
VPDDRLDKYAEPGTYPTPDQMWRALEEMGEEARCRQLGRVIDAWAHYMNCPRGLSYDLAQEESY